MELLKPEPQRPNFGWILSCIQLGKLCRGRRRASSVHYEAGRKRALHALHPLST